MATSNLTIADLKEIEKLIIRRDKLQTEIDEINRMLPDFNPSKVVKRKSIGAKIAAVTSGKRGPRGKMKEAILGVLHDADGDGVHVRDISSRIGKPVQSVQAWFQMTGKKMSEIKKVERATYALIGSPAPSSSSGKKSTPAKPKKKKKAKKKAS